MLRGDVLVQIHCYRADEMASMLAVADELGFKIRSFHHALEAYKIRDLLAGKGIAVTTWADWWGFKLEAYDGIPENAALFDRAGRARDDPLRLGDRHPAAQPGGGQGDGRRARAPASRSTTTGAALGHREPGVGARHRRR